MGVAGEADVDFSGVGGAGDMQHGGRDGSPLRRVDRSGVGVHKARRRIGASEPICRERGPTSRRPSAVFEVERGLNLTVWGAMDRRDCGARTVADRMRRERLAKTDAVADGERKRDALVVAIDRGRLDVLPLDLFRRAKLTP